MQSILRRRSFLSYACPQSDFTDAILWLAIFLRHVWPSIAFNDEMTKANSLDVILNVNCDSFFLFHKPSTNLPYLYSSSYQPRSIIRNLVDRISLGLSRILSSYMSVFNEKTVFYKAALVTPSSKERVRYISPHSLLSTSDNQQTRSSLASTSILPHPHIVLC